MIEISEYYTTNKGKLKFLCDDKEINNRPAWIKVLESDQPIKFLKVNTESGRFYYTSFVENYYLVEDATINCNNKCRTSCNKITNVFKM